MPRSRSEIAFQAVNITLLSLLCLSIILPMLHILFASVSDPSWVRTFRGLILWPRGFTLEGYKLVFDNNSIYRSILNSFLYMGLGTLLNMVLTTLGAYVLSRKGLMLNKFFMIMVTITMFFSGGVIPLYILLRSINLLNKPQLQNRGSINIDLKMKAAKLEETLKNFHVDARVVQVTQGPAVTRYEIQPNVGVKVSSIVRLSALFSAEPNVTVSSN